MIRVSRRVLAIPSRASTASTVAVIQKKSGMQKWRQKKKKKKVNRTCMPTFPLPETGPSSCGRTVSEAISHLLLPKPVFVPPNLSAAPSPGPAQLVVAAGRVGQPSQGGRLGFCLAHKQLGRVCKAWAQPRWCFVGKHSLTAAQSRRRRRRAGAQHLCRSLCTKTGCWSAGSHAETPFLRGLKTRKQSSASGVPKGWR